MLYWSWLLGLLRCGATAALIALSAYCVRGGRTAKRIDADHVSERIVHILADRAERIDGKAQAVLRVIGEMGGPIVGLLARSGATAASIVLSVY